LRKQNYTFGCFLDISQLQIGQKYKLFFKSEEIATDKSPSGTAKIKTALKIDAYDGGQLGFEQTTAQSKQQEPLPKLEFDNQRFAEAYRDSTKIEMSDKTLEHFMGTYMTKNPQFKEVKAVLEKLFNEVVHPKV